MQIQNATPLTQNATATAHNTTVGCVGICNPSDGCDRWDPMATRLQMLWIPRMLHTRRQPSLMPVRLYSPTKEVN